MGLLTHISECLVSELTDSHNLEDEGIQLN
jgi:hypothetical protein